LPSQVWHEQLRSRATYYNGRPFSLSGEVDKQGHRLIRGNWKPDFLVHVPGRMRNLLVVEVKPANADPARMADDLKKLNYFRRELGDPGNYHAAYFWIYGLPVANWPNLRAQLLGLLQGDAQFDRGLVSCIIHEMSGVRARPAPWE
jgi:hypothetical protein